MSTRGEKWNSVIKDGQVGGRGGFEDEEPIDICNHPGHNPPTMLWIPPGKRYRHVCPGCGFECVLHGSRVRFCA